MYTPAITILTLRPADTYDSDGGTMHVFQVQWPDTVREELDEALVRDANLDVREWLFGRKISSVEASGDGRAVQWWRWCDCKDKHRQEMVYYERWTPAGREAHGWICSKCRGYVQVG